MTTMDTVETSAVPLPRRLVRVWALPLVLGTVLAGAFLIFQRAKAPMNQAIEPRPARIDGDRAYDYLKKLCAFGPRKGGSAANTKQREYVAAHFKANGATLKEQKFRAPDYAIPRRPVVAEMVNLIGSWHPERTERVVIAAHYDTRPYPDMEPDPDRRKGPFLGANDGASGVAVLMEIANSLKDFETPWGVDLVLLDGEELLYELDDGSRLGEFFLGSKEFGRRYKAEKRTGKTRYVAGFVLDMVGDRELTIPMEPMSLKLAGGLVREVWTVAGKVDAPAFVDNVGREVMDDHLPMNDAGIPTIDIIDFDYPQWHTADDLPEFCSADSLAQVGRVVTGWLSLPPKQAAKKKR